MDALIVIGGTTASGKSALAVRLARECGGVIVNADASQLYRDLPLVTARPTPAEEAQAPHRLFGVLAATEASSVGDWLRLVGPEIAAITEEKRPVIVVGGTGLYLDALLRGLAPMPGVADAIRTDVRALQVGAGAAGLLARLRVVDPVMAERLRPSDTQRLARALEVMLATGRSLAEWQATPPTRLVLPQLVAGIALVPPRTTLLPRIEQRLRAMIEAGALDELAAFRAALAGRSSPLDKAVGVAELAAHLEGLATLEDALARAGERTSQYAKRQRTWLRNRLPELTPFATCGDDAGTAEAIAGLIHTGRKHSLRR